MRQLLWSLSWYFWTVALSFKTGRPSMFLRGSYVLARSLTALHCWFRQVVSLAFWRSREMLYTIELPPDLFLPLASGTGCLHQHLCYLLRGLMGQRALRIGARCRLRTPLAIRPGP